MHRVISLIWLGTRKSTQAAPQGTMVLEGSQKCRDREGRETKKERAGRGELCRRTEQAKPMKLSWSAVEVACIYTALCHMLHGKFQPETRCCWGVEYASHQRGFPFPTPLSPFTRCPDSLMPFCPTHFSLTTHYTPFLIWYTHSYSIDTFYSVWKLDIFKN